MTENEAIEELKFSNEKCLEQCEGACSSRKNNDCACQDAVIDRMLDELLQYREIGTVEQVRNQKHNLEMAYKIISDYEAIGTVEECRGALEKQIPKKIEVVNIENFVVNKLYVPYLAKILKNTEDFGNKITGKENILKYFEECDMVRKLQTDPNLIIQLFDDRPDIKEIAFNVLKESGGVKWYRYLDMSNPVIQWVNENLEGMEDE